MHSYEERTRERHVVQDFKKSCQVDILNASIENFKKYVKNDEIYLGQRYVACTLVSMSV